MNRQFLKTLCFISFTMHLSVGSERLKNIQNGSYLEFKSILLDHERMNLAAYNFFIIKQEISPEIEKGR